MLSERVCCASQRHSEVLVPLTGPGSELTHQEDPDTEYGRSKKTTHIKEKLVHR